MSQINLPAFICKIFQACYFYFQSFLYVSQPILQYFRKTIQQPTLECPICYLPKPKFKKQHNNEPHHPPHFISIHCHVQIVAHFSKYGQILRPICQVPNYTHQFHIFPLVVYAKKWLKAQIGEIHKPNVWQAINILLIAIKVSLFVQDASLIRQNFVPYATSLVIFPTPGINSPHYTMSIYDSSSILLLVRSQDFSNPLTIYISF